MIRSGRKKNKKKCRKEGSLFNGPVQLELHAFEAKVQKGSSSSFFFNGRDKFFHEIIMMHFIEILIELLYFNFLNSCALKIN